MAQIGATPAPTAQSWNNSQAPAKNEAKKAPTPTPAPAPASAPQPAPAPAALASAAMAALLDVQERLSERDQDHGRALEVISDLVDRRGDKAPKPPKPPKPPVTPPVTPPPVEPPPITPPPVTPPPVTPPPVTPPPVTPPPVTPPPVTPPPVTPPPVVEPPPVGPRPVEPEPAPAPQPAPAPPPASRMAPAQRLQAVLAQLHETPAQRFSSEPFSKREATRTTASAYHSATARTLKTAITANAALALLQAAPMNLYAYRSPAAPRGYFGINRFI
jgi:hypothetical protein